MAIADKGTIGAIGHVTSATSYSLTTITTTVDVGDMMIIVAVADNTSTTDGDNSEMTGVTDSAGNTWTKLGEYTNSPTAAANDGVTTSVFMARATSTLSIGGTITMTYGTARGEKCCFARAFTVTTSATFIQSATAVATEVNGANQVGSASFSGLPNIERLYFRAMGKEANATTAITPSTNFTAVGSVRSQNLSTAVLARGEMRINTSTGETSNPGVLISGDSASLFFALEEFIGGLTFSPGAAALALTGQTPTAPIASTAVVATPGQAVLTITRYLPTVTAVPTDLVISPGPAVLKFKGPQATSPVFLPAPAALTFTGVSFPLVYSLTTVPTATLTLTGQLPVRSVQPKGSINIPPAELILEGQYVGQGIGYLQAGPMTLTGYAPSLRYGLSFQPDTRALSLTGNPVGAQVSAVMRPLPAVLTLTSVEPDLVFFGQMRPAPASLTFTGWAPQATTGAVPSPILTPPQAVLTLTGLVPQVLVDLSISVPKASLVLTGQGVLAPLVGGNVPIAVPPAALVFTSGGSAAPVLKYFYVLTPPTARLRFLGPDPEMAGVQFGVGKMSYPSWQSVINS